MFMINQGIENITIVTWYTKCDDSIFTILLTSFISTMLLHKKSYDIVYMMKIHHEICEDPVI